MCQTCTEENALIEQLRLAKADRSTLTDDILDQTIEMIQRNQDWRLDSLED